MSATGRAKADDWRIAYRELLGPSALERSNCKAFVAEVARGVIGIAEQFGPAVALDMLYMFAFKRQIDKDGLLKRLDCIVEKTALADQVAEIFASDEFHRVNATGYLPPLTVLTTWAGDTDDSVSP